MFKINIEAAVFYHERLYQPLAKIAQDYVKLRKLDNATLKKFKIGYSGEKDELYRMLKAKGFTENEMLATDLVRKGQNGDYYDTFRKRLMFPIMNVSGKVIAFSSRKLDESQSGGKYINSSENLIYKKRQNLFALNFAKLSKENEIILVEGNMDVISLHQRGLDNVVATLGTALTDEQARLLTRYCQKVILSQDADSAGQAAIEKAIEVLERFGIDARVLQIDDPQVKDPDEYVIKYGSGRFKLLVENAISLVEFKIKMLKQKYNLDVATDKVKFLKDITKILAQVENKIEREIYIDKIASQYNISKDAIFAEVNKIVYKNKPTKDVLEKKLPSKNNKDLKEINPIILKREKMILYLLINHFEESIDAIKNSIKESDFKLDMNRTIYSTIINAEELNKDKILALIANIEDVDVQNHISEIMVSDYEITSIDKAIEDVINAYSKERLDIRKQEIIKQLENTKDLTQEQITQLEKELQNIIIELAKKK